MYGVKHCEYCNTEFDARKPWAKFCSRPCQYRAKSPIRPPEPAPDGTPWHLREDLGRKEWQLLTPEEKRERKLLKHRREQAARNATPEGKAYAVAYKEARAVPRREPHPAKDGTPWHLRRDLTAREARVLTPEEMAERVLDKSRVKTAIRRAKKLRATPPWVNLADIEAIWANRPEGYEVDHIHPLQGKHSCGLNVPWNLNYLPAAENASKHNKQPQPGYFDWFSEPWCIHAEPMGRVWTPTDYDNI